MEAVGVISRSIPGGGGGMDGCCKSRKFVWGVSNCEFREKDHLDYYSSSGRRKIKIACSSGCVNKEKEYKATKKRLKMMMDLGVAVVNPPPPTSERQDFDRVNEKMIAEQFKQLTMENKELKMRRQAKKISLKMQTRLESSSSSSESSASSESSDSECGEVVDMNAQNVLRPDIQHESLALPGLLVEERLQTNSQPPIAEALSDLQSIATQEQNSTIDECVEIQSSAQGCRSRTGNFCGGFADNGSSSSTKGIVAGVSTKKIEVCMGGKCKKSGAAALLGEFQKLVGIEGAVSGCKCMGKCRDGPNVRILNDPVKTASNPLCIGVGLEDVDSIVANFIRDCSELGLAASS
ncbi:hypothetical protein ACH5RR_033403 [Cinchona calisaya]|uniref:Diacylglycerol O-acyltransferase 3 n=1 Tax=Cinchona calisaya TaxID=153742 RepID=A0ABD2YM71_9GENT